MSPQESLRITPETKVGRLLEVYPELEGVLIEIAPPFKKLQNPVLRKTVAKVTSLSQAARVGGVSVVDLLRKLREAVGQSEEPENSGDVESPDGDFEPTWYDENEIVESIDARPIIESGRQPIGEVLSRLNELKPGEILRLITPFNPAPLIDMATEKGFLHYRIERSGDKSITYFSRKEV